MLKRKAWPKTLHINVISSTCRSSCRSKGTPLDRHSRSLRPRPQRRSRSFRTSEPENWLHLGSVSCMWVTKVYAHYVYGKLTLLPAKSFVNWLGPWLMQQSKRIQVTPHHGRNISRENCASDHTWLGLLRRHWAVPGLLRIHWKNWFFEQVLNL